MYFNASRFDARLNALNEAVEMKDQDRNQWNKKLIDKGIHYLNKAVQSHTVSLYQILAAISANHCVATAFEKTDWSEILSLYDSLLSITDSPFIRLNRSVAIAKVRGNLAAINELKLLKSETDIEDHYLFHSTIAEFYMEESKFEKAENHLIKAISLAKNKRDIHLLEKKLLKVVPI